jgi:hypothetical protein
VRKFISKRALRRERDIYLTAAVQAFGIASGATTTLRETETDSTVLDAQLAEFYEAWNELVDTYNVVVAERDGFEQRYLADDKRLQSLASTNIRLIEERDELRRRTDPDVVEILRYKLLGITLLHEADSKGRCRRCNSKAPCKTMQIIECE